MSMLMRHLFPEDSLYWREKEIIKQYKQDKIDEDWLGCSCPWGRNTQDVIAEFRVSKYNQYWEVLCAHCDTILEEYDD